MLIDFKGLFARHNIHPTGILHCGANTGQETETYARLGVKEVVYIEALPDIFTKLVDHVKDFHGRYICINTCLSDEDGRDVIFNVASNGGQSSSLLEFGTHLKQHPDVKFTGKLKLKTQTLKTVLDQYNLVKKCDFFVADLQGAEMLALKSLGDYLNDFKWLYLEVNREHVYKNCPLVEEIEEYVSKFGFKRIETKWEGNWGDCLMVKQ